MIKNMILLISVVALSGCASFDVINSSQLNMTHFNLVSITPDNLFFQGQLKINNPNPLSIKLRSLNYRLALNNSDKRKMSLTELPVVPGYSSKTILLPIQLKRELLKELDTGVSNSDPISIALIGTVYGQNKNLQAPLDFTYQTSLVIPDFPKVTVTKPLLTKNKKKLSASISIANPNSKSITLTSIFGTATFQQYRYDLIPIKQPLVIQSGKKVVLPMLAKMSSKSRSTKKEGIQLNGDLTFDISGTKLIVPLTITE